MGLAGDRLERYLGSQHSAVGLLLVWFGLPALGIGVAMASAPDEVPLWVSVALAIWGLLAVPLGISMRRKRPPPVRWAMANVLLGSGLVVLFGFLLLGR